MVYTRNPIGLSVVVLALMMGAASGQGLTDKGVKLGLNLANVGGSDVSEDFSLGIDTKTKIGLAVGGYATLDFGLPVLIRTEVLLSQKGYKIDDEATLLGATFSFEGTFGLNYLDINPLVVYPINDQISVFTGPSLGVFLSGKTEVTVEVGGVSSTTEEDIESDDVNGMDFGLIIGGGYNLGMVTVEARYSLGLTEIFQGSDMKNNVIQIMVGYGF